MFYCTFTQHFQQKQAHLLDRWRNIKLQVGKLSIEHCELFSKRCHIKKIVLKLSCKILSS